MLAHIDLPDSDRLEYISMNVSKIFYEIKGMKDRR